MTIEATEEELRAMGIAMGGDDVGEGAHGHGESELPQMDGELLTKLGPSQEFLRELTDPRVQAEVKISKIISNYSGAIDGEEGEGKEAEAEPSAEASEEQGAEQDLDQLAEEPTDEGKKEEESLTLANVGQQDAAADGAQGAPEGDDDEEDKVKFCPSLLFRVHFVSLNRLNSSVLRKKVNQPVCEKFS